MKRILILVIAVVVVAVIVNDGGRYAQAQVDLRSSTGQVLDQAVVRAKGASEAQAQFGQELAKLAAAQGITVTQFSVSPQTVHIWTSENVVGTWLMGPYVAVAKGTPFNRAFDVPFVITYDSEAAVK
jgi:hypothetical protein